MGIWCYNPTYGSYNCIYNWIRAHLVFQGIPLMFSGIFQVFMKYDPG